MNLQELRAKMTRLSDQFARGEINRMQFEAIYKHYQEQHTRLEQVLVNMPGSEVRRSAIAQGMTGLLRARLAARILSYAIYDNAILIPIGHCRNVRSRHAQHRDRRWTLAVLRNGAKHNIDRTLLDRTGTPAIGDDRGSAPRFRNS
jgi:hypothetical protein